MLKAFRNFIGGTYIAPSTRAGNEECINFYAEAPESAGSVSSLLPTPGFSLFASPGQAPARGLFSQEGRCFLASAIVLNEIDSAGAVTNRGTIAYDTNPATFCTNGDAGDQLFVTSGDVGYILDLGSNSLSTVLASGAYQGGFANGFFLALDQATSTLQISDLNDGTTWDPTQVAQRSQRSDRWVSMLVCAGYIWLFGTKSSEVWYDAGLSPFPFAPIPGAVLEYGILAPFSAARLDKSPIWLGQNEDGGAVVFRAQGFTPDRVSTHAVESAISGYLRDGLTVSDAVGWVYQENGHLFYQLDFPTAEASWVYDAVTKLWHRRAFYKASTAEFLASRARFHTFAFNKHLVCDAATGAVYEQTPDTLTDMDDSILMRVRQAPHQVSRLQQTVYHSFQLDFEPGIGTLSGQGVAPVVLLQISRDGGNTWWSAPDASVGALGQYGARAKWSALGMARDAIFRVVMSDPLAWKIVGAYLDDSVGQH